MINLNVSFRKLDNTVGSTTDGLYGLTKYPAKFIPQVVHFALDQSDQFNNVCDPFAGVGTVGIASHLRHKNVELWDINPLLLHFHKSHSSLLGVRFPNVDLIKHTILTPLRVVNRTPLLEDSIEYLSRWYHPDIFVRILDFWAIYYQLSELERALLLVPLLKVSLNWSYNDQQRQKLCSSPRSRKKIEERLTNPEWRRVIEQELITRLMDAYERYQQHRDQAPWGYNPTINIVKDNTEDLILRGTADLVITSPPYLQAQEYIRASKLQLLWLGYSLSDIRQMMRLEIPYVPSNAQFTVMSPLYHHVVKFYERKGEIKALQVMESYFTNTIATLTRASANATKMYLFVGSANLRGNPVPLDRIFVEHFTIQEDWQHVATYNDQIVAKTLFKTQNNPASGLADIRMSTEQLVVLQR